MKNILLVIGLVVIVALGGRALWAYQQMNMSNSLTETNTALPISEQNNTPQVTPTQATATQTAVAAPTITGTSSSKPYHSTTSVSVTSSSTTASDSDSFTAAQLAAFEVDLTKFYIAHKNLDTKAFTEKDKTNFLREFVAVASKDLEIPNATTVSDEDLVVFLFPVFINPQISHAIEAVEAKTGIHLFYPPGN